MSAGFVAVVAIAYSCPAATFIVIEDESLVFTVGVVRVGPAATGALIVTCVDSALAATTYLAFVSTPIQPLTETFVCVSVVTDFAVN